MSEHNHDDCNCGCGCGCGDEEFMTIFLDNDEELKCSVLDIFELEENDNSYIALLPVGEDEVLIYRYIEEGENFKLENIETDEEFSLVEEAFFSIFDDVDFENGGMFEDGQEYEYEDEFDEDDDGEYDEYNEEED